MWRAIRHLTVAVLATVGSAAANDEPPADVRGLLSELDDADYQVRRRATEQLVERGAEVLPYLTAPLKDGSLEQRMRALDVVSRVYSRGERSSFYVAEQMLDHIARRGIGSMAHAARLTLESNYLVRQRLAVAEIERMGGQVLLVQSSRPLELEDPEVVDALLARPDDDAVVVGIMIDRTWTGGDEGLRHVRRLSRLQVLYRDKKAPLSEEAWNQLQNDMPHVSQQVRGPAYLGITRSENRPLNGEQGCGIRSVTPGSAAAKAGMMPNDVVTAFDNHPVPDFETLIELISEKLPGDVVPITVLRNGEPVELTATLTKWPKLNYPP
jgi:hypothetical protein